MRTTADDVSKRVRMAIYERVVATGHLPDVREIALRENIAIPMVADAFRMLADAHVVVLKPRTVELCWAPPFSEIPTPFRVHSATGFWYAPCAWDMFGIPAALKCDAQLDARCAWSGEPMLSAIHHGEVTGSGIIHLEVPARRFWDDIFYT